MKKRWVINADDFGFSRGVNYGIVDVHTQGVVNSTTMMVNMPATEHAVHLAESHPQLGVGIHLTLTMGKPLSSQVDSLMDETGHFRFNQIENENQHVDLDQVAHEWEAQILRFLSWGLYPTHLDSHHHVHGWKSIFPVIQWLSDKYQLPVRNLFADRSISILRWTDCFIDRFYAEGVINGFFTELQKQEITSDSIEVMCHPAYVDRYLKQHSSYCDQRLDELEVLIQARHDFQPDGLAGQ